MTGAYGLRARWGGGFVAAILLVAGCGGVDVPSVPASIATVDAPADWQVVTTDDGTMQLTLPPWVTVVDTQNAIHAKSAPAAPGQDTEFWVMAIEPGMHSGDEPNRLREGEDLSQWLDRRLGAEPGLVATTTTVALPAGVAVRLEGVAPAGAPDARHILAFAMSRPAGVAYFQVMGPESAWPARQADIERMVLLFRVSEGSGS